MSYQVSRTQDKEIYLKEERYDQPKEISKLLLSLIKKSGLLRDGALVCDIGCAAGEYLYYMQREFPGAKYTGFDVVPELLDKARAWVPEAEFKHGSILDAGLLPDSSVDFAIMSGVCGIFDEFEPLIANLLRWTRTGGRAYITDTFNPYPVDVWIKYRRADDPDINHRESGWNLHSTASMAKYLDNVLGPGNHTFTPFEMPFDLPPNPDDPARTWTFMDSDGHRHTMNGLSIIANREILEIRP